MKTTIHKICGVTAFALLLLGVVSCGSSKETTDSSKVKSKTIKEFTFQLPKGWKVSKEEVQGVDLFLSANNDSVYIFINHAESESMLSHFAENRFRSMLNEINGFEMISSFQSDTLCEIVYTGEEENETFRQIFDIRQGNNGLLYGITGDYTYGDSAEVSNIIRSFKFNN